MYFLLSALIAVIGNFVGGIYVGRLAQRFCIMNP
jgi:hypothetical protein